MMAPGDVLQGYQQLLKLSNTMLEQAREGLWDDLVANESTYVRNVESMARNQDPGALPAALRVQIRALIKQILDNEVLLKTLLAERMDELRSLVQTTSQQQKVTSAYGRFSNKVLYPGNL
ncbi:flagella biosynthesis regulatory protein FliT [Pantoea dispersa]|uniref:flagella biosynthesis regulatory protein FliT n=1 Tax=Pantoea dispersa TaxID=59814 RepID=UPI00301B1DED